MSPCIRPNHERDLLEHGLNALTRRRTRHTDPDLVRFAARLHTANSPSLPASARNDIWSQVLSSATTSKSNSTTTMQSPMQSPSPSRAHEILQRVRRLPGNIALPRIPAPAVVLFGVAIALIIALSGLGHDGGEMVTPTAYAQHAATAVASPTSPQPTSTLTLDDNNT